MVVIGYCWVELACLFVLQRLVFGHVTGGGRGAGVARAEPEPMNFV